MNLNVLSSYGFDVTSGLARCLNDQELYEKLLSLFMEDDTFPKAAEAQAQNDMQKLFEYMHALKGACGNAGMNELYEALSPLVDMLRKKTGDARQIEEQLDKVEMLFYKAKEGITLAKA